MKLHCDACQRLLPPASWAVVDGALHLTCACGAVAVRAPSLPGVTPRVEAPDTSGETAAPAAGDSWLEAEWVAVAARWDDPEAHRRLLAHAEVLDDLPALGRRYKERLEAVPGDAAAARAREELIKRAAARLLVAQPRAAAGGASTKNVVVATVLLTVAGLLVVLLVQLARSAGAP